MLDCGPWGMLGQPFPVLTQEGHRGKTNYHSLGTLVSSLCGPQSLTDNITCDPQVEEAGESLGRPHREATFPLWPGSQQRRSYLAGSSGTWRRGSWGQAKVCLDKFCGVFVCLFGFWFLFSALTSLCRVGCYWLVSSCLSPDAIPAADGESP